MLPLLQLATALVNATLVSAHGPWSRAVGYRYLLGSPPGLARAPTALVGWRRQNRRRPLYPQGRL